MKTIFEFEALRNHVDLLLALASEVLRPLLDHIFRHQDISRQTPYPVGQFPDWEWVQGSKLLWYLLVDVVDERLIYVLYFGGVSTPCINGYR